MMEIAERVAYRLEEETPFRLIGYRLGGHRDRSVFAFIETGAGRVQHNLRNRALDMLTVGDRDKGVVDQEVLASREAHHRKKEREAAKVIAFADAWAAADRLAKEGKKVTEEDMPRLIAESMKKWGVDDMVFRNATGERAPGGKSSDFVKGSKVERKEWINLDEFGGR